MYSKEMKQGENMWIQLVDPISITEIPGVNTSQTTLLILEKSRNRQGKDDKIS